MNINKPQAVKVWNDVHNNVPYILHDLSFFMQKKQQHNIKLVLVSYD